MSAGVKRDDAEVIETITLRIEDTIEREDTQVKQKLIYFIGESKQC